MMSSLLNTRDWLRVLENKSSSRRIIDDDHGVSPVIATILLLAITVLLTGMLFMMFQSSLLSIEKNPPSALLTVRSLDNGFQVVEFSELDQQLDPNSLEFQLIPNNLSSSDAIVGIAGDSDVYGVIGNDVSFYDRDSRFTVSQGDYFVINASAAGTGDGEWTMRLFYYATQSQIGQISLPSVVS
mgnify:CR=1 FL=1